MKLTLYPVLIQIKDMLKRKYIDFNECMKDVYRFLAKNLYQDNHLTL